MLKRLLLCLLFPIAAFGACTGSSPSWTTTPDRASVVTCISGASRNDTITVSAGSATWSSGITVTKGITLQASGTVTLTPSSDFPFFTFTPDATTISNEDHIALSGFTFSSNSVQSTAIELDGASGISGTKPYRYYVIKNNFFRNMLIGGSNGWITASSPNNNGELRGVISGNDFDRPDIVLRVFSNNDTGESANTAFNGVSFGTEDSLYFESNTIHWSSGIAGPNTPGWIEVGQGGRLIVRYNTWDQTNITGSEVWDIHGFQNWNGVTAGGGQTGAWTVEFYGNRLQNMGSGVFRWFDHRSTAILAFDNIYTGATTPAVDLYGLTTSSPSSGASCPSNIVPIPSTYNALINSAYFWNNTENGTESPAAPNSGGANNPQGCTFSANNSASVGSIGSTAQGGFWNLDTVHCTSSACTQGIGQGTTAPTGTCTKGTAYWVASTPGPTVSSSVIQAASLYKCTATNTWTQVFTALAFPHPLISAPVAPSPAPATAIFAVLPAPSPTIASITSLTPSQSYVSSKGCSQDGLTFTPTCPIRILCGGCSSSTAVTFDGTKVTSIFKTGELDIAVPLSLIPVPTAKTNHTIAISSSSIPVLQ